MADETCARVGARRRLWQSMPSFPDIDALNAWLEEQCIAQWSQIQHGVLPGTVADVHAGEVAAPSPMSGAMTTCGTGRCAMRHDPAIGAVVVMLRGLKMYGMAQAVGDMRMSEELLKAVKDEAAAWAVLSTYHPPGACTAIQPKR
jgi:hypothetical protein